MALFKCKMCGGNLDVAEGMTVCECEYCGTKQTLPKSSDDQQLNMINRANHFRQQCEFDKAMEIYERMLQKDDSDAEIYWSIVLCRYGIEYVDDPLTKQKIPTCHRAQYTLITQDPDYLEALSHADELQKEVYRREAEYIANVQKGILEISNKEEPFDIFICYKETDSSGKRTQDSVLAQDLYYQLTQEDFKVFFSRITLEDKLGSAYEPYIFAALNSSKVMVVVGTKPEYFNAVWVRNEWSRYLMLMKEDHSKILIPAYKDMDPYDLPEALSMFQAQDMSKLGFIQDLIRGIRKITGGSNNTNSSRNAGTESASGSKADNLIKRGFMSLEDGDMQKAANYFEQALNEDAEEARAYEGLLLVELNLRSESELENLDNPFDQNSNYKKAVRFADEKLREKLNGYVVTIKNRSMDRTYYASKKQLDSARTLEDIKSAAEKLLSIKGWRDASDILYDAADKLSEENIADSLELAVSILTQISDYKDAAQKIDSIKEALSDIEARKIEREKAEHEKWLIRRKKRIIGLVCAVGLTVAGCLCFYFGSYLPSKKYDNAMSLFNEGAYEEAATAFSELGEYNDSGKLVDMCVKLNNERIKAASKIECNIGDIITVGKYEQDNDLSNGTEPIEWQVLDIRDGKALLISKYILDFRSMGEGSDGQWASCSMRTWLNNDFYNAAFLDIEKNRIPETLITDSDAPNNRQTDNDAVDVKDKIFLLSMSEAKKYFPVGIAGLDSSDSLITTATEYATNKEGLFSNVKCDWWLRTFIEWRGLNGTTYNAGCVNSIGIISEWGTSQRTLHVGVRPVMWYVLDPEA